MWLLDKVITSTTTTKTGMTVEKSYRNLSSTGGCDIIYYSFFN